MFRRPPDFRPRHVTLTTPLGETVCDPGTNSSRGQPAERARSPGQDDPAARSRLLRTGVSVLVSIRLFVALLLRLRLFPGPLLLLLLLL